MQLAFLVTGFGLAIGFVEHTNFQARGSVEGGNRLLIRCVDLLRALHLAGLFGQVCQADDLGIIADQGEALQPSSILAAGVVLDKECLKVLLDGIDDEWVGEDVPTERLTTCSAWHFLKEC